MASSRRIIPDLDHSSNPSDYYFAVGQSDQDGFETDVMMSPRSYFDREHAQSDWHVTDYLGSAVLEEIGLVEEMEGMMLCTATPLVVRLRLLAAGFRESPDFYAHFDLDPRGSGQSAEEARLGVDDPEEEPPPHEPPQEHTEGDWEIDSGLLRPRRDDPPGPNTSATAYERMLAPSTVGPEEDPIPATDLDIGRVADDPRKITLFCDCCGKEAVYTLKAANRLVAVCPSTACLKATIPKLEEWAQSAKSKAWSFLQGEDIVEAPKPKLSVAEEVRQFQKNQGLPVTGELDARTKMSLREEGRGGMIPLWEARLLEENTPEEDSPRV